MKISPKSINLPEVIELSGSATQMIGIKAEVSEVKEIVDSLSSADAEGGIDALMDLLESVDFSILNQLVLFMQFKFSTLGKSGGPKKSDALSLALPDSNKFEIGTASMFATTYKISSGNDDLEPGLYMYASASPVNIIKELLRYALSFTASILDFLPDWLPDDLIDFKAEDLVDNIKTSGTSNGDFAVGMAFTAGKLRIMLKFPLIIDELGYIKLECTIDFDDGSFKCKVQTKFNLQIFGAIADALEDGVLWVAKKLDKFADDLHDAGKEVLAAGMSTLGDAADKVGSAFSKTTVAATVVAIKGGEVALDALGDAANELQSWAADASGAFEDFMDDVGEALVDGFHEIGDAGKQLISGAKDAFDDAEDGLRSAASTFSGAMGCSVGAAMNAMKEKNSNCEGAKDLQKTLKKAGKKIDKAMDEVEDAFKDVGNALEDVFKDIGNFFGLGKKKKKKISSREVKLSKKHESGCHMYRYIKVTKYYKRKCNPFCKNWKYDKTTESTIGEMPKEDCVRSVLEKVVKAMDKAEEVAPLETKYNRMDTYSSVCNAANAINKNKLVNNGLRCESALQGGRLFYKTVREATGSRKKCSWKLGRRVCKTEKVFSDVRAAFRKATINCSVPKLALNGSFSGKTTISDTTDVRVRSSGVSSEELRKLREAVIEKLVSSASGKCDPK